MRKFLVLATVALGFVFTACDDEDNLNSSVLIGNKSGSNVIVQLDTLYLDARAENLSGTMEYLWTVDGKEVSTASTYKFSQPKKLFKFYSKIILWQRYASWLRAYRPCIHSQWSVS